jgi:hypothetical protein
MIIRKNKAFLLFEVLVAVLIVSTSIVFINHAFSSSLKAQAICGDYLTALLFLEDKAFDFESNTATEEGSFSEEEDFMGMHLYWEDEIRGLDEEDLGGDDAYDEETLGLKKLEFSLRWKRQDTERTIDINTYMQFAEPKE